MTDEVDRMLDELIKGKKPEEILGADGVLRQLTKRLVERALEGEMTHHLGYKKHAVEGHNTGNSRNGKTRKRVTTESGDLDISVPRDRDSSFEPVIVEKGQRRLPGFDDKVIALYARGLSTRDIQGHLEEMYGVEVSPALITAVTDTVLEDVTEWQSRPLDPVYPVVYLDAIHVKLRVEGRVESRAVYLALALNLEGRKDLLGLWVSEGGEGAKFWLSILTELKSRGVGDILIACVDGLRGFPEAIATIYPRTQVQLCVVHLVRSSTRFVSWKESKNLLADLKQIYRAPTAEAGKLALSEFGAKWDSRYPTISKTWHQNWDVLSPFFSYPEPIRRVIYTTNAVESLNSQLRRVTRNRGSFPTPDSVRKVLYLALRKASKKWTMPIRDWGAALNQFSILFPGRLTGESAGVNNQ
jgi:putative transposase